MFTKNPSQIQTNKSFDISKNNRKKFIKFFKLKQKFVSIRTYVIKAQKYKTWKVPGR